MFTANTAKRLAMIAQKRNGSDVTLRWTEWPNGEPDPDLAESAPAAANLNVGTIHINRFGGAQ